MRTAALVFPHQLFADHPAIRGADLTVLVEDPLFFTQYRFHRQKLMLHRASMKRFAAGLIGDVLYLDSVDVPDTASVADHLVKRKVGAVRVVDPCDDWLEARLSASLAERGISLTKLDDPDFLTPRAEIEAFAAGRHKLHFTEFYIAQRKRLGVLLDRGKPVGGKWSFDPENRKKLPKGLVPPAISLPTEDAFAKEARRYVKERFPDALGADEPLRYPTSRRAAAAWLAEFVEHRLNQFGDYEDAIRSNEATLFHSVLTPMLNVGLISPREVVEAALAKAHDVPLNSLEGFIRQVIGWREFVRLVYLARGRKQRSRNFWDLPKRPIPAAFYDGTTGIEPVDTVIRRTLRSGYCHHIERLMILGNFFLLCDVHPHEVYRWFMELFVDAYDWVMVPNVYGMSQHADGGLMTTKPYISGSSYVRKMSDFKAGPWCETWDGLYWRFIDRHAEFFASNPRTAVMVKMRDKLGSKLASHHRAADAFLSRLQ